MEFDKDKLIKLEKPSEYQWDDQQKPLQKSSVSPKNTHGKSSFSKLGPIALIFMLLAKFGKYIFVILQMGKFSTLITMFISVFAYATIFGLPFAFGFVMLVMIHELGHYIVLKKENIPCGAPVFIPFVGAIISMKGLPRNAWVESKVGLGGPLLGTLGALLTLGLGLEWEATLLLALAQTGFMVNLFNMVPLSPLDGGRILGAVSPWISLVGMGVGAYLFYLTGSPIILLILIMGFFQIREGFSEPVPGYYNIPFYKKVNMGVAYFVLLALMIWGIKKSMSLLTHLHADSMALTYKACLLYFAGTFLLKKSISQKLQNT